MLQTELIIEFIICGPDFNPDSVTKLLEISPTKYTIRGSMKNSNITRLQKPIDFVFTIYGHVYKNEQRSDIYLKKNTLDFIADLGSKLTMDIEFW